MHPATTANAGFAELPNWGEVDYYCNLNQQQVTNTKSQNFVSTRRQMLTSDRHDQSEINWEQTALGVSDGVLMFGFFKNIFLIDDRMEL